MIDATTSADRRISEAKPAAPLIDIMIVVALSALAFFLEDLAISRGWIPFGEAVRGAITVIAGAIAAVAVVLIRGGTFSDLGFRRPERWARVPLQVTGIHPGGVTESLWQGLEGLVLGRLARGVQGGQGPAVERTGQ